MKQSVGALDCFTVQVCESEDLSVLSIEDLDVLMESLEDESNKEVDKADKEIKSLTTEVMKQPARVQLDKVTEDELTKSIIKRRKMRSNRQKRQASPPNHSHQESNLPRFVPVCHYCNTKGHI
ncbi:hypothetical protein QYF36_024178 [Acer negundo]|nr:hypothetical protein QYF36_024178 [Acer negundo]